MYKRQKQNYPGSVASYNTRPGNEVDLFYNAPEPTRGLDIRHLRKKEKSPFSISIVCVIGKISGVAGDRIC